MLSRRSTLPVQKCSSAFGKEDYIHSTVGKLYSRISFEGGVKLRHQINSNPGLAAVREWVYYREEVGAPRSHIRICNDNQAERSSLPIPTHTHRHVSNKQRA